MGGHRPQDIVRRLSAQGRRRQGDTASDLRRDIANGILRFGLDRASHRTVAMDDQRSPWKSRNARRARRRNDQCGEEKDRATPESPAGSDPQIAIGAVVNGRPTTMVIELQIDPESKKA